MIVTVYKIKFILLGLAYKAEDYKYEKKNDQYYPSILYKFIQASILTHARTTIRRT